jgi:hypothetical protein
MRPLRRTRSGMGWKPPFPSFTHGVWKLRIAGFERKSIDGVSIDCRSDQEAFFAKVPLDRREL